MKRVLRFIRSLENYVNKEEYRPRRAYADERVLLALVSKSIWVGRAVCSLVKTGYPEEAFGLTRTLTDIFFTVRFICNKDSEERARRFANYLLFNAVVYLRNIYVCVFRKLGTGLSSRIGNRGWHF